MHQRQVGASTSPLAGHLAFQVALSPAGSSKTSLELRLLHPSFALYSFYTGQLLASRARGAFLILLRWDFPLL